MLTWSTKIRAINPLTGDLCTWCGPKIKAFSEAQAKEYLQENELGYCEIDGLFMGNVTYQDDGYKFDHDSTSFNLN